MDTFTEAYIEAALWSSIDNEDENDDRSLRDYGYTADDFADTAMQRIQEDCRAFQETYSNEIGTQQKQAGCDFWFTRNGHGVGFWDGDWPEPTGTILTKASEAYRTVDLYRGSDGLIYCI